MAQSAPDLDRFRLAVRHWLGLDLDPGRKGALGELLARRARASSRSAAAYLAGLEAMPSREELRVLAQELTVTETSFFRNPDQVRALAEVVLPECALAARDRPLRILSAGCASGEEAFTIAACVRDCPELAGRDVEILGVDINPAMLSKAATARYSDWSLRQTPEPLRARWFRRDGDAFLLDERLRTMVAFEERNLIVEDPEFWSPGRFDILFFRNVLMYFPQETARAVVARMARSLAPGGFLFLGYAETLRGLSSDFDLCSTHETFYYRRRNGADARPERGNTPPPAAVRRAAMARPATGAGGRDARPERTPEPEAAPQRRQPARAAPRATVRPVQAPELRAAVELIGNERFDEAARLLSSLSEDRAVEPEARLLTAILETHGGNVAAAERICEDLLARDDRNAGAHYLMALCRESRGDREGAARHDRVAAYLDPGFAMPRLHLGLLARRAGDSREASRELRHALLLIEREESARFRLFGGGFGREALSALCRAELAACEGVA